MQYWPSKFAPNLVSLLVILLLIKTMPKLLDKSANETGKPPSYFCLLNIAVKTLFDGAKRKRISFEESVFRPPFAAFMLRPFCSSSLSNGLGLGCSIQWKRCIKQIGLGVQTSRWSHLGLSTYWCSHIAWLAAWTLQSYIFGRTKTSSLRRKKIALTFNNVKENVPGLFIFNFCLLNTVDSKRFKT